jgi:hypothetical protein
MNPNPNERVEIKCIECGARPYPELSLPEVVRQDFDLLKNDGQWRCSQHRKIKKIRVEGDEAKTRSKKSSPSIAAIDDVASVLGRLSDVIANADFEDGETGAAADSLVDEAQALLAQLRSKMAA